jgi:predicted DNA-binding helix-hairpin-helix protein
VRDRLIQLKDERQIIKHVPKYVPAGQTTQMVVGAHQETDQDVLVMADRHYKEFKLNGSISQVIFQSTQKITIYLRSVQHHLCYVKIGFIKVIG